METLTADLRDSHAQQRIILRTMKEHKEQWERERQCLEQHILVLQADLATRLEQQQLELHDLYQTEWHRWQDERDALIAAADQQAAHVTEASRRQVRAMQQQVEHWHAETMAAQASHRVLETGLRQLWSVLVTLSSDVVASTSDHHH